MIEYGLLAALVSLATLAALQTLGPAMLNLNTNVANIVAAAI